jgi:pimeloyl-ACP methyl ester carboxylesterase
VAEAGEGEPVVLLHGWPQHWYVWRKQIPALAEHHRVICPDLRGFGWSEAPRGSYAKETLTTDIARLLQVLDLGPVRLAGHDWGGFVGFLLCLRHPELVSRYLAMNIIHPWASPGTGALLDRSQPVHIPILSAPVPATVAARGISAGARLLRRSSAHVWSDEELEAFAAPLREPARARATQLLYRTFLLREAPALLAGRYRDAHLQTPTLLLFGSDDPAISTHLLGGYERNADDMEVELVPGIGHFIVEEAPGLVLNRMASFLGATVKGRPPQDEATVPVGPPPAA